MFQIISFFLQNFILVQLRQCNTPRDTPGKKYTKKNLDGETNY